MILEFNPFTVTCRIHELVMRDREVDEKGLVKGEDRPNRISASPTLQVSSSIANRSSSVSLGLGRLHLHLSISISRSFSI